MAKDNDMVRQAVSVVLADVIPSDVELVTVRVAGQPPQRKVTVIIAQPGGMTLDHVAEVTKTINSALDALANSENDPIPGGYTLEVTTPGLHWPLTTQADFLRVGPHRVQVALTGGESHLGTVLEAGEEQVVIQTDHGPVTIPYSDIETAVQALPF